MLKPGEAFHLGQFIQHRVFEVFLIDHSELGKTRRLLPAINEPHSGRKQLARLIHVTQVGRTQTHKPVELVLVLIELWKGCPHDQAT
jgi:hypothetical protein